MVQAEDAPNMRPGQNSAGESPPSSADDRERSQVLLRNLTERVKELTALHNAARLLEGKLGATELLELIAALMPPAFQFPEITEASIRYGDLTVQTPGFHSGPWSLLAEFETRNGTRGALEVVYTEERPASAEGPFLAEERRLIDSIVEMMASTLDRRLAEDALRHSEEQLQQAVAVAHAERDRAQLLLEVTNAVVSELDLKKLLGVISDLLKNRIPHHFASVTLWDKEAGRLRRLALAFPTASGLLEEGALVRPGSPTEIAFERGETTVFQWHNIERLGEPSVAIMRAEGLRAVCCVPLKTSRDRYGVLTVGKPDDEPFPAGEVALLEQIAGQVAIAVANTVAYQEISALKDRLTEEKLYLEDEITHHHDFTQIIGGSPALSDVIRQVRTVGPTDATVLLLGETGTGKELLARALHDSSRRRAQTFVRVNAAAMPTALVESELFGYERGAFTGATSSKVGRLELAHRGTLFLDEVGDIPIEVQPKLLRALQEQEFERLGGTRTQRVDVRLIAATNRNLDEMVAAGTFRSDLYYRLSVFPLRVPPLRERPEDIPALVHHFVRKLGREMGRSITTIPAATMDALQRWTWPGNIRELENVIERAVILSPGNVLQVPLAALQSQVPQRRIATGMPAPIRSDSSYRDGERELILTALREASGIIGGAGGAAARLGLKRTTLHSKMRKLGIVRPAF